MAKKLPVLIYDSECSLCTRFKGALELIDTNKMINYMSIHDSQVYVDFPQLSKSECEEVVHFIDEEGNVYKGGEVVEQLVLTFPQVKKFAWLIQSESGKKAMNLFYDKINDIRHMHKRKCFTCGSKRK